MSPLSQRKSKCLIKIIAFHAERSNFFYNFHTQLVLYFGIKIVDQTTNKNKVQKIVSFD